MAIKKTLSVMSDIAAKNGISTPYIVGGLVRDVALGIRKFSADVDITTGDKSVVRLAELFAAHFDAPMKQIGDEHFSVHLDEVKYDFSTNFKYPDIVARLAKRGIKAPTSLQQDVFSRDFTVNSLLLPLDLSGIIDLTKQGKSDIENLTLRCPLDCDLSFQSDPKRILRAYFFKAKFNLKMDKTVVAAIRKNAHLLSDVARRYAGEIVNRTLRLDPSIATDMIADGTMPHLPETKLMREILLKQKKMFSFNSKKKRPLLPFVRDNFDYGERDSELMEHEVDDDDA